jgi:hypothetical protein
MGWVQRDSIDRLRHAKRYSGFFSSICTNPAWTGFTMATGVCEVRIRARWRAPIASSSGAPMRW